MPVLFSAVTVFDMLRPRPRLLVFLPFFGNLIQLLRRVVADVDRFSAIPQSV